MARLVLALAAAVAALQVASPCPDPSLALRCPDLAMAPPSHLRLDRKRDGRRFLRMQNSIVNVGNGPAELFAQRSGPREMAAQQVITDTAGGRRRFATGAEVYYTSVPTRGGDYWKFDQAARFELWSQLPGGQVAAVVRVGPKLRYCLRDLRRVGRPGPGSLVPARRVYPACNQKRDKRQVTLGTSVGWADVYPASYPGNIIDVTGLKGCFVVVQRADPANHIAELNEANNASVRVVRLPYRPGRQGCPPYVP
jgi:hypothetical protein